VAVVGAVDGTGVGDAVGALHTPENMPPSAKLHTALEQSEPFLHFCPPSQPKQSGPPQSTSVSKKLTTPSKQISFVGTLVGLRVGEDVGLAVVGLADGVVVGVVVGWPVGTAVGSEVGRAVGLAEGVAVGMAVGDEVGAAVSTHAIRPALPFVHVPRGQSTHVLKTFVCWYDFWYAVLRSCVYFPDGQRMHVGCPGRFWACPSVHNVQLTDPFLSWWYPGLQTSHL
jgi:tetrahydromethanopterin S-methyltransferase subunit G